MMHYLYVLSSWSFIAEGAVREVREHFGPKLEYDWCIAMTDYSGKGPFAHEQLQFYYDRLEAATGRHINLGWWHEGYNWLVPDRVVAASRLLGARGSEVRLALAGAGLQDGLNITDIDVATSIAGRVSGLETDRLRAMATDPQTILYLFESSRQFQRSGVSLRPAFQLTNDLGDRVVLSGIWQAEPLRCAIQALVTDEESYRDFLELRGVTGPPPYEAATLRVL